jgi:hypothetical protein
LAGADADDGLMSKRASRGVVGVTDA